MPLCCEDQITVEKTPGYFIDKDAPELIYKMNPKIKLILIIRDPTYRAISEYTQVIENDGNKIDSSSYSNFSTKFEKDFLDENGRVKEKNPYIKRGIYVLHLKKWLEYFPLEQILILDGEKLILDPFSILQKVEKYLNLQPFIRPDHFVFDKNKGFMCIKENSKILCLGETKGRKHIFVSNDVKNKIKEFYEPYNKQLFELIKQEPFF